MIEKPLLSLYRDDANSRCCYKRSGATPAETVLLLVKTLREEAASSALSAECELAAYRARDAVLNAHGVPREFIGGGNRGEEIQQREREVKEAAANLRHADECLRFVEGMDVKPNAVRETW